MTCLRMEAKLVKNPKKCQNPQSWHIMNVPERYVYTYSPLPIPLLTLQVSGTRIEPPPPHMGAGAACGCVGGQLTLHWVMPISDFRLRCGCARDSRGLPECFHFFTRTVSTEKLQLCKRYHAMPLQGHIRRWFFTMSCAPFQTPHASVEDQFFEQVHVLHRWLGACTGSFAQVRESVHTLIRCVLKHR